MPQESLKKLYDGVSTKYDIGDFNTFSSKMQNPDSRKRFYDQVSQNFDIGNYDTFEAKVSTTAPEINPNEVFVSPKYTFSALPEKPKATVFPGASVRPLPFFNENPEALLVQPGGKKMLQDYGYIITEPEKKLSAEEIASAQNELFFKREVAKEKQKGLSEADAYDKVVTSVGGTPPNFVNLAMEQSITGSVFRMVGLKQQVNLDNYPFSKKEELASGVVAMLMPADAALFSFGGKAANLKQVGKYADKAANIISTKGNIPINEARVLAKTALEKITGGAGGFAAFDAGRDITSQLEYTGKVDLIEAVIAIMKGAILGGSVGALGMAGSMKGKAGEFLGEVFGLGTVAPVLEGEEITKQGFIDAAATIVGLKFLNQYKKYQRDTIIEPIANVIETQVKRTGQPIDVVANKIGTEIKTSLELALEGRSPEKTKQSRVIQYETRPVVRDRKVTDIKLQEVTQEPSDILSIKPERVQLNEDVNRLSKNMDALEKSRTEQKVLDELQIEIDAKVERLNQIGVEQIETESVSREIDPRTPTELKAEISNRRKVFQEKINEIESQLDTRDKSEIKEYNEWLKKRDILNREIEYDPYQDVPLSPPELGKERVAFIDAELSKIDFDYKKLRSVVEQAELESYLEGKDVFNRQFTPDPMLEVPLHPADVGRRAVQAIEKQLKPVELLEGQKKEVGLGLQKQYSDLDVTLRSNQEQLKKGNLTDTQRERLETSSQKIKELQRDTKERAESNGIEMQIFLGIPSKKMLKNLFGSEKRKPTKYTDAELDRLYNNAMDRLEKLEVKDNIQVNQVSTLPISKTQGTFSKFFNWFTSDVIERAGNVGTPTSKEASQLGRRVVDIQKQVHGQLSNVLDIALKASGSGKAAKDLARFVEVEVNGKKILMNRMHAAIEGLISVNGKELLLVEAQRDLIEKRGRIFEQNEIMQEGKDGVVKPFKVIGRNIAPRIMSSEFYRILDKGIGSQEFNILVNEFAKASGVSNENVKKYFSELKDNMSSDSPESATRTTQAEHSRKWKNIPHAIKVNGELVPLVEYRPYEYARRLADTGESRIGVARVFGQELANTSIVNKLKKQISEEGGSVKEFHEMIRALSGAPVETSYMDAGFTGSKVVRGAKSAYNFIKQSTLSGSFIPNIAEPLGNVRKFGGMPALLKSIFKLSTSPNVTRKALEAQGAITVDIANLSIDPNRPYSSFIRGVNELQRRGFGYKYINEFQEVLAAQVAVEKVAKFKQGKGTSKDALLLREMGYTRSEAESIAKGQASKEAYDSVIRRAPSYLTGGAQRTGEQSRLERNRIFTTLSAFETYSQMKLRSLLRTTKVYAEASKEAVNEKDYKKFVDANRIVASEFLGSTASGAATQFLLAYIYGGKDNVEIKWNEVQQNPLEFLLESWAYTSFAGVYGSILQSTAEGKLADNFLELSYPVSIILELEKALSGKGKYTYLEAMDRVTEVTKRYFPANRIASNIAVGMGFGNPESKKDDNAIKAYYRWRFKNKFGGTYISNPDEELKQFRTGMKKAYNAIRASEDPQKVNEYILAAIDQTGKDTQSISSSIRGRQLLSKSKVAPGKSDIVYAERLEKLRKTIGENAYQRLQMHDELLTVWSSAYN